MSQKELALKDSNRSPELCSSSSSSPKPYTVPPYGYVLILMLIVIFVLALSMLVAVPILETQVKREKEEELIFRGKQYVEAIRLYQQKKPASYPSSFEELIKQKCLRRLYPDPMSSSGEWNILVNPPATAPPARASQTTTAEKLLVVSPQVLKRITNPQIVGVVSSSTERSVKIYNGEEYYNLWLFYYGQTPGKKPELVYQLSE